MDTIKHTAEFDIAQPVDVLFPLFSPEGEKLWVPGWDYENISGSSGLHEDDVFLTKNHDHASTDAIWLVKKYEPTAYLVQFYKVEPEEKIGIITVQCAKQTEELTRIRVSYRYIALSDRGRRFIENFTCDEYQKFIEEWQDLLLKYYASRQT